MNKTLNTPAGRTARPRLCPLLLFFLLFSAAAYGQNDKALQAQYCECLEKGTAKVDTANLNDCFRQFFESRVSKIKGEAKREAFILEMNVRLSTECKMYRTIAARLEESSGERRQLDTLPPSSLDSAACRELVTLKGLHYLESAGNDTKVYLEKGQWREVLDEGRAYSKLSFRWISGTDYELTFIESNDPVKKVVGEG